MQATFSTRKRDKHDHSSVTRVQARWTSTALSYEDFSIAVTSLLAPLATGNRIQFYTEFKKNSVFIEPTHYRRTVHGRT
jgi:hypothetical protein